MNSLYANVQAGPPQSADETGELFDLAGYMIKHPSETYYVKVSGCSMVEAGIFDGDILVVDRSLEPQASDIVVADIGDSQYTVKRFKKGRCALRLVPENDGFEPIEITPDTRICGVARFVIHKL